MPLRYDTAQYEDWLVEVGSRGWILLTKDDRIHDRGTERMAIEAAKLKAFVLTSTQLQGSEMADAFVRALPGIKRLITKHRATILGRVSTHGKVSLL